MTTSFSGALEPGLPLSSNAPVAGNDGVLTLDQAQRCISVDPVFAHIFDIDPATLQGHLLSESTLPGPLVAVIAAAADAALAGNGVRRAHVDIGADEDARSFSLLALPGRDENVTVVLSPSTGTGGHAARSARDDRTAHLRAEAALFMRDHVLSVVSHDLRGPLNAIHSWGYVLERKVDATDPAAQRALGGIRSGVEQQVALIERAIDTTRAETKALPLTREPLAVRALFEHSATLARKSLADARGVSIEIDAPAADEQLDGDAERLTEALWLMLSFATEASVRGAVVMLKATIEGGSLHAKVHFTASANALEDPQLPHVLETFGRKQALQPREAARIAWALALCKRVAEAHGGTFEHADIVDGADATMSLRVPLTGA